MIERLLERGVKRIIASDINPDTIARSKSRFASSVLCSALRSLSRSAVD